MLRSDLCDFSDAYIVVKGIITVTEPDNAKRNKSNAFKKNAPFISWQCRRFRDIVMSMYNLLEYSKNYRKTTGSLQNYYSNQPSILYHLILNLLNTRQVLQELCIILLLVMVMMQSW